MERHLENITKSISIWTGILLTVLALTSCTKAKKFSAEGDEDLPYNQTNYPNDDLNSTLQNSGGNLSAAENQALQNVANEMEEVNPQEGAAFSEALLSQAEALIQKEKEGENVTNQKMALGAQMLKECADRVAVLMPVSGQSLVGLWNGKTCAVPAGKDKKKYPAQAQADFQFTVAGDGVYTPYLVKGGTEGKLGARPDGSGVIQGKPWYGELVDQPTVGRGVLYNKTYAPAKNGAYHSCEMAVTMKSSRNLTPERFVEAMRRVGGCYRTALVMMSPMMDDMFKDMDPQLAAVLQQKMLGITAKQ